MLLDIDELPTLHAVSSFFAHNRVQLISFHDCDHGDGTGAPLRPQVEKLLMDHAIAFDSGPIRLFCMPRVMGYGFNPISVFFCYTKHGALAAIVYEVHNTFGERHSYVFDAGEINKIAPHGCAKSFHVSPFLDMAMHYEFWTRIPGERISLAIRGSDSEGPLIVAALEGKSTAFTSSQLARGLLLYPLVTVKVTAAIHWHALRLFMKNIAIRRKPDPSSTASTGMAVLASAGARDQAPDHTGKMTRKR